MCAVVCEVLENARSWGEREGRAREMSDAKSAVFNDTAV